MAGQRDLPKMELFKEGREVVGEGVEAVAPPGTARTSAATPVVGDAAQTLSGTCWATG
jgi:hypothetical protein